VAFILRQCWQLAQHSPSANAAASDQDLVRIRLRLDQAFEGGADNRAGDLNASGSIRLGTSLNSTQLLDSLAGDSWLASPLRGETTARTTSAFSGSSIGRSAQRTPPNWRADEEELLGILEQNVADMDVDEVVQVFEDDDQDVSLYSPRAERHPRENLASSVGGSSLQDFGNSQEDLDWVGDSVVGLGGAASHRGDGRGRNMRSQSPSPSSTMQSGVSAEDSITGFLRRLSAEDGSLVRSWLLAEDDSLAQSSRRVLQMGAVLAGARLSDEEIRDLPKVRFDSVQEQQCSICLENFRSGEFLTQLPCKHFFHVNCVARWFTSSTQCPLCRSKCSGCDDLSD